MSLVVSWLSTFVHLLVLPPAGLFVLIVSGAVLGLRWPRAGRVIGMLGLLLLFFFCTGIGSTLLIAPLEHKSKPLLRTRDTGAQAIVVLAAGRYRDAPEYGGQEIPDYIALARLRYAAKLYRDTGLPVLVSGSNASPEQGLKPKALAMAAALEHDFAVPVRWREQESETTAENATYSARMLKAAGVQKILLVTDAMHMPRAEMLFRVAGMDVVPAPTIFFSTTGMSASDLFPEAENLRRSYYAIYEWLGLIRDSWLYSR